MILSIYLFWAFLVISPTFILLLIILYKKIETQRKLKLGLGLTLISSYGLVMSILATSAFFMIKISPSFPPSIQLTNLNKFCNENTVNCIKLTDSFVIDLVSLYMIILVIGLLILAYLSLQMIMGVIFLRKIRPKRNPLLSLVVAQTFSKSTGLPLNNIHIVIVQTSELQAYSFSRISLKKPFNTHYIVLSTELLKLLSENELNTVIAHEYGHIYLQDTMWIPILKFLTGNRINPLKILTNKLVQIIEIRADRLSAQWTRLPGHLASALFKIAKPPQYPREFNSSKKLVTNLSISNQHFLIRRINLLLELELDQIPFKWPKW